jgi:hypothetical protein
MNVQVNTENVQYVMHCYFNNIKLQYNIMSPVLGATLCDEMYRSTILTM